MSRVKHILMLNPLMPALHFSLLHDCTTFLCEVIVLKTVGDSILFSAAFPWFKNLLIAETGYGVEILQEKLLFLYSSCSWYSMWRLCQSRNVFSPPACKGTKYSVSFVIPLLHECALRIVIFTQTPPPIYMCHESCKTRSWPKSKSRKKGYCVFN